MHTFPPILRGFTYSLTSIVALLAGYLMRNSLDLTKQQELPTSFFSYLVNIWNRFYLEWPALVIPILASIFFFMFYAKRFPAKPEREVQTREGDSFWEPVIVFIIIAGLLLALIFRNLNQFTFPLILVILTQVLFYGSYGIFLGRKKKSKYSSEIQHQLVWSVILSIGISLYIGLIFSKISDPELSDFWFPLTPILVVGGLFFLTEVLKTKFKAKTKRLRTTIRAKLEEQGEKRKARLFAFAEGVKARLLLIVNGTAFIITVVLVILVKKEIIFLIPVELADYLIIMQFCVIVSAYLAVFEAWGVTSFIAETEQGSNVNNAGRVNARRKSSRYSLATLTALTVSVWALPLFFVYSQYSVVFLVFFGLHALAAFSGWALWGQKDKLITFNWSRYKAIAGYVFLIGMAIITLIQPFLPTSDLKSEPTGDTGSLPEDFLSKYITWGVIIYLLGPFWFLMRLFIRKYNRETGILEKVFEERINFTRILVGLCIIACVTLQLIYDKDKGELARKSDQAFIFYIICIGICLLVELGKNFRYWPKLSIIMSHLFAFLVLIRTVPSLLIALAVFLPSIYTGRSVWASVLSAVPFFLSAAGGYALNDYYDVEKDSITKPYRAIPSGKLSRLTVLRFSRITISLAVLAALGAFFFSQNPIELGLYILCILGVALYNVVVKHVSLSKTFLTAVVSSIPLLFSVIAYQYPMVYLFLPIATCSFILGREWLMDVRDMEGDTGRTLTIPMRLGTRATTVLGFVFQFATVLLLLPIAINFPSYWSISLIIMIGISSASLAKLWTYNSGMFHQRVVQLLWLPMLFGVLLFVK